MDRIASLITRVDELRRRIYASIPFEDRLAALFCKLSLDTIETLGRALGAEFLLRGVTDMPDPGPRWNPKSRNPALTLPAGYMRDFGRKAYGLLLKKFHNPELVEDTVSQVLLEVTTKPVIEAQPRASAESWIIQRLMWRALSTIHSKRRTPLDQSESLNDPGAAGEDEGRELIQNLEDPSALKTMQHQLSPAAWRKWMEYLAQHVHEDIPLFIALSMQGYENEEIIGDPRKGKPGMLPHYKAIESGPNSYLKYKVYRIPEVSREFFKSHGGEAFVPV